METPAQIGPFPIRRALGSGAVGSVFLADHPRLGLPVAIKVLHDRDPDLVERFRREAALTARIKDPRVVEVLEGGLSEFGPYLVLQYCPGRDLAELLKEEGALPPERAAALVAEIARGVAAAHAVGVIHRDLKPANVLVGEAGRPKVTDFGIARSSQGATPESLTQSGVILGTPAYMAPEQMTDAREVDAQSDVYALGVILYECLAGRVPFTGSTTLELMHRVVEGRSDPLPASVPAPLAEIVTCAMARVSGDRFRDATLFAEALEDFEAFQVAAPARGQTSLVGTLALGLAILGVIAFVLLGTERGRQAVGLAEADPGLNSPSFSPAASPLVNPSPSDVPVSSPAAGEVSPTPSLSPIGRSAHSHYGSERFFLRKQEVWRLGRASDLQPLADAGSSQALLVLGLRYQGGLGGVLRNVQRAIVLIEEAASLGDADAMFVLGTMLGRVGESASSQAWFKKAAALGNHEAAWTLAVSREERLKAREQAEKNARLGDPAAVLFLCDREFGTGNREQAEEWCRKGIALGLPGAFSQRARLERVKLTPDYEAVARDYLRAAESEDAEGLCGIARCLLQGQGVAADPVAGEKYLSRCRQARPLWVLAEQIRWEALAEDWRTWWEGVRRLVELEPQAMSPVLWGDLGLHLLEVQPKLPRVLRDSCLDAAAKLLSRAEPERSLDPRVIHRTGLAVSTGRIPVAEETRSKFVVSLYRRSAELGLPKGLHSYGYALIQGEVGTQNVGEGLKLLKKAAEGGLLVSWEILGDLHQRGIPGHLEPDSEEAIRCLRVASEGGSGRSCFKLATLLLNLTRPEEAFPWGKRSHELGYRNGSITYAHALLRGFGVEPDPARALPLLRKLAVDSPIANELLAKAYALGQGGLEVDAEKSAACAAKAKALRKKYPNRN